MTFTHTLPEPHTTGFADLVKYCLDTIGRDLPGEVLLSDIDYLTQMRKAEPEERFIDNQIFNRLEEALPGTIALFATI